MMQGIKIELPDMDVEEMDKTDKALAEVFINKKMMLPLDTVIVIPVGGGRTVSISRTMHNRQVEIEIISDYHYMTVRPISQNKIYVSF